MTFTVSMVLRAPRQENAAKKEISCSHPAQSRPRPRKQPSDTPKYTPLKCQSRVNSAPVSWQYYVNLTETGDVENVRVWRVSYQIRYTVAALHAS